MRAAALEELKARLLLKYGAEAEPTISTQLAEFFQRKASITLQDLNAFENLLAGHLGFPAKRKAQWSRLQQSSARESPTPPEAVPQSRVLSQSFDLRAVPTAAEIVPITRHRKAPAKVQDSALFPRYENRAVYTPVPDKAKVNDTVRTSFYWKEEEKPPGCTRPVDEWGDIAKWDITKYQWEQQDSRRAVHGQKREYRDYLSRQIQQKEAKIAAEKLEAAQAKAEIAKEAERLRAAESRQARAKRQQYEQHQRSLQEDIDQRALQRKASQQAKATERLQLDHRQKVEKEAEAQFLQDRRIHCLSLTDHNLKAAADRQDSARLVTQDTKELDKKKAQALVQQFLSEDHKKRLMERHAARDVQLHNQQIPRRGSTAESHHTAHAELFRLQEQRQRQTKHQLLQNLAVLSQQALDKTQRDGVWRVQEEEQAELWRQEQVRQFEEDRAKIAARKAKKRLVKQTLTQQVQAKQQAESQARRLPPAEAQLNRPLLQAAIGAL